MSPEKSCMKRKAKKINNISLQGRSGNNRKKKMNRIRRWKITNRREWTDKEYRKRKERREGKKDGEKKIDNG